MDSFGMAMQIAHRIGTIFLFTFTINQLGWVFYISSSFFLWGIRIPETVAEIKSWTFRYIGTTRGSMFLSFLWLAELLLHCFVLFDYSNKVDGFSI